MLRDVIEIERPVPATGPKKIEKSYLRSELLHHVHTVACSGIWLLVDYLVLNDNGSIEAASPCGWPNNFSCHLPVFAADLVDNEDSPARIWVHVS